MTAQREFDWTTAQPESPPTSEMIEAGGRVFPVSFRPNPRARNYVLYLRRGGVVDVTIPRRGSLRGAKEFLVSRRAWIERAWRRMESRPPVPNTWEVGAEIWWRGERKPIRLTVGADAAWLEVHVGEEICGRARAGDDLRPLIQRRLRELAVAELPPRVLEFAARHGCAVRRIVVRDQRTRWGSCSRRGTISLNWRLVQLPPAVCDYIILHELMHLREMNHSPRFWAEVRRVCPDFEEAERWLKLHGRGLGM